MFQVFLLRELPEYDDSVAVVGDIPDLTFYEHLSQGALNGFVRFSAVYRCTVMLALIIERWRAARLKSKVRDASENFFMRSNRNHQLRKFILDRET